MMQLIPTIWAQNLCLTQTAGSSSLFLSLDSSYSHNKTYSVVAKDQDTSGTGTWEKQRQISKGKGKVTYGAALRIALRCFTPIWNTNFSHLFALQAWDQWEALGWTVSHPGDRWQHRIHKVRASKVWLPHESISKLHGRSCQQGHTGAVIWGTRIPCQMSGLVPA